MYRTIPQKLGPYVVLNQIGSGGMGAVYRALDPRLQREVAIKVLHRNTDVAGAPERFLQEARTISSLNHPNICTVFDIGEQDGDSYFVMELLKGEALKDRMLRGPVPEDDLREIAFRVALALQSAHSNGVVHRDIKPANIFLVADATGTVDVKVLDFGLAKLERDLNNPKPRTRALTRSGSTVGTVEYMSPEQACGEELDARSDLFSLGAVLYEMATGRLPFPGATSAIVFTALLGQEPLPLRDGILDVSADLDRIIRSLLTKDRADRMPSATTLLEALSAEESNQQHTITPIEGSPRTPAGHAITPAAAGQADAQLTAPGTPLGTRTTLRAQRRFPSAASRLPDGSAAPSADAPSAAFSEVVDAGSKDQSPQRLSASSEERAVSRHPVRQPGDPTAANRKRRTGETTGQLGRLPVSPPDLNETAEDADRTVIASRRPLMGILLLVLVGGAAAAWLGFRSSSRTGGGLTIRGPIQILPIKNQTGDSKLERGPAKLLEILLAESPMLTVRAPAAADVLQGGSDATMARIQKSLGAQSADGAQTDADGALYTAGGSLSRSGGGYLIHLSVRPADGANEIAHADAPAASPDEVPAVLSRMVGKLRSQIGEDAGSVTGDSGELLGTGDILGALSSEAEAEARLDLGDDAGALAAFTTAVREAPSFVTARLRMAELLLHLHADREANAALDAVPSLPAGAGPHLRAEREYVLSLRAGSESALETAERWRSTRPFDADAQAASAEQLLRAGRSREAMAAARNAVHLNPFCRRNEELQTQAELESGQLDAAWSTQTRAFDAGLGSPALSMAAAVLKNDRAQTTTALDRLRSGKPTVPLLLADATYRVNSGDLSGARLALDRASATARGIEGASSAGSYVEVLKLWNEALAGECPSARASDGEVGEAAVLAWMTSAWCGLPAPSQAQPGPDLRADAARLWVAGDKAGALTALSNAHMPDALLLRARLERALGRSDAAITDARNVVEHRGTAYLSGSMSYPAALALLSAAYQSKGDLPNAETERAALREIWRNPAAAAHLLQVEAEAH